MECEAMKRVRNDMGLTNVQVMVPFVRTLEQAERVTQLLAARGLARGENGLKVIMMCEVPSNAVLADEFLQYFDGFSIGSNDLTQLTLGLDRDSGLELLAADFDERDPAVQGLAVARPSGPARPRASTSASAARAPATTRISPVAGRRRHFVDLAQSRQRDGDLAKPRKAKQRVLKFGLLLTETRAGRGFLFLNRRIRPRLLRAGACCCLYAA